MSSGRYIRHYVGWFGLSAIMFVLASVLTMWVTNVGGGVPIGNPVDVRHVVQAFGVFVRDGSDLGSQRLRVSYSQDRGGHVRTIGFWFPEKKEVKVLLNNVTSRESCELVPNQFFFDPQKFINILDGAQFNVFTLRVSETVDGFGFFQCKLKETGEDLSFTHRVLNFWFVGQKLEEFPPTLGESLASYDHYQQATINFSGVAGAERFSFNADAPQGGGEFPEGRQFNAAIPQDSQLVVQWIDFYSEQFRDLMLIVIGSLIAIGATTLIEGLRPLIS